MQHRYIPLSEADRRAMCEAIGIRSPEELFAPIPHEVRSRFECPGVPRDGLSEQGVQRELERLAARNRNSAEGPSFLGAGAYDRHVPAVVDHVLSRSEFYTAYTPYQAEVSQGTLQAIYEYQSVVCALTGMEVSNASHYDGATALAEAMLIATSAARNQRLAVSRGVNPRRRRVLATYARAAGITLVDVDLHDGRTISSSPSSSLYASDSKLIATLADVAGLVVQQPNFLGVVEDLDALRRAVPAKAHLIVAADPVALGLLKSPGECGADIVVGDGVGAGLRLNAGGPGLGFMAVSTKLMRKIPGRVVGRTKDLDGKPAFVLTLQAREQHIRRAQASSNICSNQALCALAFTVYMSSLGKTGLAKLAECEFHRAHAARRKLLAAGCQAPFEAPFFNEFPVRLKKKVADVNARLLKEGVVGGYDLSADYPELGQSMLVAVTEKRTMEEIETLARKVGEAHG